MPIFLFVSFVSHPSDYIVYSSTFSVSYSLFQLSILWLFIHACFIALRYLPCMSQFVAFFSVFLLHTLADGQGELSLFGQITSTTIGDIDTLNACTSYTHTHTYASPYKRMQIKSTLLSAATCRV